MVKYLLDRPVSVFVTFGMFVLLGFWAYVKLPTSLLPDIPVPEVIVRISGKGLAARELERSVVDPLRQHLMQLGHLRDMRSETEDDHARIRLRFDYGTRMDLAYVEANEKVDAAMGSLPAGLERPAVVKVNTTDLPVFELALTMDNLPEGEAGEEAFVQLSDLARQVIKRRLEQLPEVALVDMSGLVQRELLVRPNRPLLESLGMTEQLLENAFHAHNIETGSATMRDGNYEYSIRFTSALRTPQEVADIRLWHGGRLFRLGDLAEVRFGGVERKGEVIYNGKRALLLAVIKQANARMGDLQKQVGHTLEVFRAQYPHVVFVQTHDQSGLLDITLASLRENLVLGLLLVLLVTVYFLRDVRMPLVIGFSLFFSLIISMGGLYLFRISLNVISLAGVILAMGMMIDNAIIVTDEITQYRQAGLPLDRACAKGTMGVATPMLSSMLTTVAVFLPLMFMSGMAGAVFYDQALATALSLGVAYLVSITFLPVFYKLCFQPRGRWDPSQGGLVRAMRKERGGWLWTFYDRGMAWVFGHSRAICGAALVSLPLCVVFWRTLDAERMPAVHHDEVVVAVDWGGHIHAGENAARAKALVEALGGMPTESTVLAGRQQFLIGHNKDLSASQAKVYVKVPAPDSLPHLQERVRDYMRREYPQAAVSFLPPETAFDEIFSTADPDLVMELYPRNGFWSFTADSLHRLRMRVGEVLGEEVASIPHSRSIVVRLLHDRLALYQVSAHEVVGKLKRSFGDNRFGTLRNFSQYIPVRMEGEQCTVEEVMAQTQVEGVGGACYPLNFFVTLEEEDGRKTLTANENGEYLTLAVPHLQDARGLEARVRQAVRSLPGWEYTISGTWLQSQALMREFLLVLLVSLVMMYLILTAQFGSFLLPLILLVEIPIDVTAALASLWCFGHTLNLMSAIGIIVACGIVVNDSILKLDVMHTLRRKGVPVHEAIHEAGHRRLRAMVMTSLTSVLAFVPILFSDDLGSVLQRPLAVAMIGAMLVGTLVSLFVVPLLYSLVYRKEG